MKPYAKKAIAYAEKHGYAYESTSSKGYLAYANGAGHRLTISPWMPEYAYRSVVKQIDEFRGVGPDPSKKRNTQRIKERDRKRHELAVDERARHQRRLDALLNAKADESLIREAEEAFRTADREVRELERLMQEAPAFS